MFINTCYDGLGISKYVLNTRRLTSAFVIFRDFQAPMCGIAWKIYTICTQPYNALTPQSTTTTPTPTPTPTTSVCVKNL